MVKTSSVCVIIKTETVGINTATKRKAERDLLRASALWATRTTISRHQRVDCDVDEVDAATKQNLP